MKSNRGSTLPIVLIMSLIAASFALMVMQRGMQSTRLNIKSRNLIESRSIAESLTTYALPQISYLITEKGNITAANYSTGANPLTTPTADFFRNSALGHDVAFKAGMLNPPVGQGGLTYIDPDLPQFKNCVASNLYAFVRTVPIIAKAEVTQNTIGDSNSYVTQNFNAYITPIFTFAAFYHKDIPFELQPGPQFDITGPVHANGNAYLKKQSSNSSSTVNFRSRFSCVGDMIIGSYGWCNWTNGTFTDFSEYNDTIKMSDSNGILTSLKGSSPTWRDHKWGQSSITSTTRESFKNWATDQFGDNVSTKAMNQPELKVPGLKNNRAGGRALIEPPTLGGESSVEAQKISRKCSLYIVVNPAPIDATPYNTSYPNSRKGILPNGTAITMLPQRYRAFLSDGTEVILPGQPNYGDYNATPVPTTLQNYASDSEEDQLKYAIITLGAPFTDLRRARNAPGYNRSAAYPYRPYEIYPINLNMRNLKIMMAHMFSGNGSIVQTYETAHPTTTNFNNHIFNPAASMQDLAVTDRYSLRYANTGNAVSGITWDGGIYIYSCDAEKPLNQAYHDHDSSQNPLRAKSGVRLIYGRGPVPSKLNQGLSIATNDALYIAGHYNADGSINSAADSTTYSATVPESGERPAAIFADAITVLSQPVYDNTGKQLSGWNDGLSDLVQYKGSSSSDNSWMTTPPSNSNTREGFKKPQRPKKYPFNLVPSASQHSLSDPSQPSRSDKLPASDTEISCAFLVGVVNSTPFIDPNTGNAVPTNDRRYSGGLHNYPRLLEQWTTTSDTFAVLALRTSMVAMFESQVATEPWQLRYYNAPTRAWGLNTLFTGANGQDAQLPPLTPMVVQFQRINFRSITPEEYNTISAQIDTLPSLP